jgi:dynein assembly factor with WDR repeat domains 1
MTAGSDRTCRIWSVDTGAELQRLEGHEDEIFSYAFNYEGDTIITGSKDNTCRIWKDEEGMKAIAGKAKSPEEQKK